MKEDFSVMTCEEVLGVVKSDGNTLSRRLDALLSLPEKQLVDFIKIFSLGDSQFDWVIGIMRAIINGQSLAELISQLRKVVTAPYAIEEKKFPLPLSSRAFIVVSIFRFLVIINRGKDALVYLKDIYSILTDSAFWYQVLSEMSDESCSLLKEAQFLSPALQEVVVFRSK